VRAHARTRPARRCCLQNTPLCGLWGGRSNVARETREVMTETVGIAFGISTFFSSRSPYFENASPCFPLSQSKRCIFPIEHGSWTSKSKRSGPFLHFFFPLTGSCKSSSLLSRQAVKGRPLAHENTRLCPPRPIPRCAAAQSSSSSWLSPSWPTRTRRTLTHASKE